MCDSILAVKSDTADGVAIFAKNSDRPPNEAQVIEYFPAADYPKNETVKCTYIEIPQAEHTNAILLSKPYWIWGAEMGVNDQHVVIGNEAVFPKEPVEKNTKLIGMDLVRLGLERGNSARQAMEAITGLLEQYGQGGSCIAGADYYYSSFLIADPDDAWVVETVGKRFAVKQVVQSDSISNYLTIGRDFDQQLSSPDLIEYALRKGWIKSANGFNFGDAYNDFLLTTLVKGRRRRAVTMAALQECKGRIDARFMMNLLRTHLPDGGRGINWQPQNDPIFGADICWHGSFGPIRDGNTTGSMVVYLDKKCPTIFVTGTASPCTSIFKPLWMDAALPDMGLPPADEYDHHSSLFWQHELLHRATLADYQRRIAAYADQRDKLEQKFVEGAFSKVAAPAKERAQYSADCFAEALEMESKWYEAVKQIPAQPKGAWLYDYAWKKFNTQAKMPKL